MDGDFFKYFLLTASFWDGVYIYILYIQCIDDMYYSSIEGFDISQESIRLIRCMCLGPNLDSHVYLFLC